MEIPHRYKKAIVDPLEAAKWAPGLLELCQEYTERFEEYAEQGKAPMFLGLAGRGKTYAAAAILNTLDKIANANNLPELSKVWVPVGEALNTINTARDMYDRDTYFRWDYAIKNSDIAVFDDFAYLRDHPKLKELFWIYVNARYDRQLPTIFTANIEMKDWEDLFDLFGPAIGRRMKEMSEGLTLIL